AVEQLGDPDAIELADDLPRLFIAQGGPVDGEERGRDDRPAGIIEAVDKPVARRIEDEHRCRVPHQADPHRECVLSSYPLGALGDPPSFALFRDLTFGDLTL